MSLNLLQLVKSKST